MKKTIIVLMLAMGISHYSFAQDLIHEQNGINKSVFDEEIIRKRNYIEIQFEKKNKLRFWLKNLNDLKTIRDIDSLVNLFLEDIQPFADSLSRPTADARKIQYYLTQENRNFQFKSYPAQEEVYTISKDKQIKAVKIRQDTVEIMFGKYNLQRNAFENKYQLFFILNDWTDLRDIAKNGITQHMDSIIMSMERKSSKIFQWKRGVNAYYSPSSSNSVKIRYSDIPPFSLGFGVSARFLKNQIITGFNVDLQIAPHQNSLINWLIGYEGYFFSQSYGFLNLGVVFNKPRSDNNVNSKVDVGGKIVYGYLLNGKGDFFPQYTQHFSIVGLTYKKRSSIEPEIYFQGLFKNIYPGLKISVGF
jgi:hypothetical protein